MASGAMKLRQGHKEKGDPVILHEFEEQVIQRLVSKQVWTHSSSSLLRSELEKLDVCVVQLAPGDRLVPRRRHSVLMGDHF